MAPYRVRGQAEDSRSDSSSLKDKLLAAPPAPTTAKGRRNTSNTGSNLKDVTAASAVTDSPKGGSDASSGGVRSQLSSSPTNHRYSSNGHLSQPQLSIDIDMRIISKSHQPSYHLEIMPSSPDGVLGNSRQRWLDLRTRGG